MGTCGISTKNGFVHELVCTLDIGAISIDKRRKFRAQLGHTVFLHLLEFVDYLRPCLFKPDDTSSVLLLLMVLLPLLDVLRM